MKRELDHKREYCIVYTAHKIRKGWVNNSLVTNKTDDVKDRRKKTIHVDQWML